MNCMGVASFELHSSASIKQRCIVIDDDDES